MTVDLDAVVQEFRMPKAVAITGRTSSITNSFINSIIPVVPPTRDELLAALRILEMTDGVRCAYCADPHTEWDHLRPLVMGKQPTGYISEIHNLVPSCGKCNQSKGNKGWETWMFGHARLSPSTRGVEGLTALADRLRIYERWAEPTKIDFAELAGPEQWRQHWENHRQIVEQMKKAQVLATEIREMVRANYLQIAPTRDG